jgi:hypothetical protein
MVEKSAAVEDSLKAIARLAAGLVTVLLAGAAFAQPYPDKMVCRNASDLICRPVGDAKKGL